MTDDERIAALSSLTHDQLIFIRVALRILKTHTHNESFEQFQTLFGQASHLFIQSYNFGRPVSTDMVGINQGEQVA